VIAEGDEVRNWMTIGFLAILLVGGGLALIQLQGDEPLTLTAGYIPQLDSSQALLLAAAVGFLVVSTVGMGATIAALVWVGSRQVAVVKTQDAGAQASRELREPSKAAPRAASRQPMNWGSIGRATAVAANVLVIAFVAFLTLNHYVLNPPTEEELHAVPPGQEVVEPPPPVAQPGDIQAAFAALPPGDASRGQTLFTSQPCASCHSLTPDQVLVGPSLAGVATRAQTRVPGYSAGEYIYESVVHPGAYVNEGFQDGLMPQNFGETLTPQQLADLVAYLHTLE
jgi:mono/diheme cytochrome c family protein